MLLFKYNYYNNYTKLDFIIDVYIYKELLIYYHQVWKYI